VELAVTEEETKAEELDLLVAGVLEATTVVLVDGYNVDWEALVVELISWVVALVLEVKSVED